MSMAQAADVGQDEVRQKINVRSFAIKPAITEEQLAAANGIWSQVYKKELSWLPQDSDTVLYDDEYHPYSSYLLAYINQTPVGLMRIIHRAASGLPVERFVDISGLIKDEDFGVVECQRLLVLDEYRTLRSKLIPFGIWPAFMRATLQYCLRNSVGYMLADCFVDTPTTPIKSLKTIGFVDTGLRFIDTELANIGESALLLLDNRNMLKFIYSGRDAFRRYLAGHDPDVDYPFARTR